MIITTSCDDHKKTDLELKASYKINVSEPSGLSINDSGTALYTVSDKTSIVYKLSLTGDVIETIDFKGSNLEGVSTYTENKLLLAEESKKKIIVLDMLKGKSSKHKIAYKNYDRNSGIEGVTFDKNSNTIFILNESMILALLPIIQEFFMKILLISFGFSATKIEQ